MNEDENLPAIPTPAAKDLADTLRGILDEVNFDSLNRALQQELFGGDYARAPYPVTGPVVNRSTIREGLESCVQGVGPKMTIRQKYCFEFFMLGESLTRGELEILLGEEMRSRIDDFVNANLFAEVGNGRIRMNGLFLLSKRLTRELNTEVIYIFADLLFYDRPEQYRVYVGFDSFELLNKLRDLDGISGTGIDMGSGSGIQLIGALKLFPNVRKLVGCEKDRRAINVSQFNVYLNGVDDRATIVENEKELAAALGGNENQADFAISNPPFMPVPEYVEADAEDVPILTKAKSLCMVGEKTAPCISLKKMWPASGWGGADGLSVLKPMLEILFPLIRPAGRIIVYAEFAGNSTGPTKIAEFVQGLAGWTHEWQPLKPTLYHFGRTWNTSLPSLTAESMARDVIQHIINGYPELSQSPYNEILTKYTRKILDTYQRLGITHFHKGFFTLKKTPD